MKLRDLENWLYARVRDPRAADVTHREVGVWQPSVLEGHKYCLLTTFRKDGTPVDTPVWFGTGPERVYIRSGAEDGKVKRIRRDPRVLVAPCTARGRPLGDPVEGAARILAPDESERAEAALRAHYGVGRRLYRRARRRLDAAYIEVSGPTTPRSASSPSSASSQAL